MRSMIFSWVIMNFEFVFVEVGSVVVAILVVIVVVGGVTSDGPGSLS
jgi:hypothetical protein